MYVAFHVSAHSIDVRKTTDGKTWSRPASAGRYLRTSVAFQSHPPRCVVRGDDVWITYSYVGGALLPPEPGRMEAGDAVRLIHSSDGGASFGSPVRLSDSGKKNMLPALAIDDDGTLRVAYYEGAEGQPASLVSATSSDKGRTWKRKALTGAGTFTTVTTGPTKVGNRVGLAATLDGTYATFANNASGSGKISFLREASF